MPRLESARNLAELGFGDVDEDQLLRRLQRIQQEGGLVAAPGAELHHPGPRPHPPGHAGQTGPKDRELGAGRVVLVEPGDLLEEHRPPLIVEQLGREAPGGPPQGSNDFAEEAPPCLSHGRAAAR